MKKITLFLLLCTAVLQAQRFDWVSTAGYAGIANSYNGAIAVARDSQGNLYTLDAANEQQQCQGVTANPLDGTSIFLYKFNSAGEIIYIKPIGTNFKPLNVVVGENDNVYVLGSLMGTNEIQINNQTIIDTENRNYIFKLNPAGDLIWRAKNNVSFSGFTEASLLYYSNNHIYFQTDSVSISKLDTAGQYVSTLTANSFIPNTAVTNVSFKAAGVLSNGDLVFSAMSRGTITYGTTVLAQTGDAILHSSLLTIRTTENLNFVWGIYTNGLRNPDLGVIPMAIGNDNGIYLGLQISGTLTVGSTTITNFDPGANTIGALLKVDDNGTKIWLQSTSENVKTATILNNPDGSGVFCGGQIFGFQPITLGTTSVDPVNGNAFISKIDYNGVFQNSFSFANGPIGSYVRSLATNNTGVFYVGGKLNNNTPPVFSCIARQGNTGLFLAKFTDQPDRAPTPSITASGNTLSAAPVFGGTIQWFLNGTAISGANGQSFTATQTGNYTVTYTLLDYTACVSSSTIFNLAALGIDSYNLNSISIFPNPSNGILNFKSDTIFEHASLQIIDTSGRIVFTNSDFSSNESININSLKSGIYIVKINHENQNFSQKVIKY